MLLLSLNLLGILPDCYPTKCDCGWYYSTNENRTSLLCSNPDCPVINAAKLPYALDTLHINASIGEETAALIVKSLKLDNVMKIFKLQITDEYLLPRKVQSNFRKFIHEMRRINAEGVRLSKFITAWSLPGLGDTTCNDLFSTFTTPAQFYNAFSDTYDMYSYVAEKLCISVNTDTVNNIVTTLLTNKEIILDVAQAFNFQQVTGTVIKFSITGDITQTTHPNGERIDPRDTFEAFLNDHLNVNSSFFKHFAYKKQNYLVRDTDIVSSKLERAKDKLITSPDLIYTLLSQVGYKRQNYYLRINNPYSYPECMKTQVHLSSNLVNISEGCDTFEDIKQDLKTNYNIVISNEELPEGVDTFTINTLEDLEIAFGDTLLINPIQEHRRVINLTAWEALIAYVKVAFNLNLILVSCNTFPFILAKMTDVDDAEYLDDYIHPVLLQIYKEAIPIGDVNTFLNILQTYK